VRPYPVGVLAAVAFAASVVPMFIGGLSLSGLADRLPRRRVMIGADLASGILVAAMVLPGVPLAVLIVLLFAVTMIGALFLAAGLLPPRRSWTATGMFSAPPSR
jgi:hypothetical protein